MTEAEAEFEKDERRQKISGKVWMRFIEERSCLIASFFMHRPVEKKFVTGTAQEKIVL